ncbi:hypothetical protein L227DRAFT_560289 [Lentinus tigrinus ALCF2SS1-6]|uniref:Uncharacterized protein n=1 Tax=Lentinus tigrinus ALCF2SS1-6 TaxID=1328759 RepID=A0A5C2SP68_9APHY|nr:hypothetical protein L227DRAFT_560289 [Lentinus tigrinus ALCF2SS1-6]
MSVGPEIGGVMIGVFRVDNLLVYLSMAAPRAPNIAAGENERNYQVLLRVLWLRDLVSRATKALGNDLPSQPPREVPMPEMEEVDTLLRRYLAINRTVICQRELLRGHMTSNEVPGAQVAQTFRVLDLAATWKTVVVSTVTAAVVVYVAIFTTSDIQPSFIPT